MTNNPFKGLRILVTRSSQQAGQLSDKLKALGAEVIEAAVISIGPPPSWAALDAALQNCHTYDWIVFASVNAVEYCLGRLEEIGKSVQDLQKIRIAAIGPATNMALSQRGLQTDFVPSHFIAEEIVSEFPGYPNLNGLRILWPRTNAGRTYLADKLTSAGAQVDKVEAYQTSEPENKEELADNLIDLLRSKSIQIITLASSQTTTNLFHLLTLGLERAGELSTSAIETVLNDVIIASIGPETSATARKLLGKVDVQAESYTIDGLVKAIRCYPRQGDKCADLAN